MASIDTTHDDALREVPFAKEDIYNGRILHVEKWKVTCPNGREAAREIVVHKGSGGGRGLCLKTATRCSCVSTA